MSAIVRTPPKLQEGVWKSLPSVPKISQYLPHFCGARIQSKSGTRRCSLLVPKDESCPIEKKKWGNTKDQPFSLVLRKRVCCLFLRINCMSLDSRLLLHATSLLYFIAFSPLLFRPTFIFVWQKTRMLVKERGILILVQRLFLHSYTALRN